jgi:DNA-binding transcriptional ArsR family regulator
MSSSRRSAAALRSSAAAFAALGDETRLALVGRLSGGEPQSIARLASGTPLTRQAVTKHLRVLERAGVVRSLRVGRESRFALEPKRLDDLRTYLETVSRRWDEALARLKSFVEEEERLAQSGVIGQGRDRRSDFPPGVAHKRRQGRST